MNLIYQMDSSVISSTRSRARRVVAGHRGTHRDAQADRGHVRGPARESHALVSDAARKLGRLPPDAVGETIKLAAPAGAPGNTESVEMTIAERTRELESAKPRYAIRASAFRRHNDPASSSISPGGLVHHLEARDTGFGLAIWGQLVELMNGRLEVREPARGAAGRSRAPRGGPPDARGQSV